jgi:transcriptional regulator with XRE-family HTH domain
MRQQGLYLKSLRHAAELAGGTAALALRFKMSRLLLSRWLSGETPIPIHVFFKVVDYLAERDSLPIAEGTQPHPPSSEMKT